MAKEWKLFRRPWAVGTAVVGFAMLAIYIALIVTQGETSYLAVLPWATLMAIAAIIGLAAAHIEDRRTAGKMMVTVVVLYALLGAVSGFSIGIGFLLAAVLATVAAIRLKDNSEVRSREV